MYTDETFALQRRWAERGLFLMRELLPFMGNFARSERLSARERNELGHLLTAAAKSTESAFLLVAHGQLWDAEVVVRSVSEGSLKFAYIVQGTDEFPLRFKEYTEEQVDLALMKDDQKARVLLTSVADPDSPQWRPIRDMVLPNERREELRARYDKSYRRSMESRWGYVGILETLTRSGDPFYRNFTGLSYSYSIASHIQHADYLGVSIAMDRDLRSPERRDSAHLAHLSRLISDCFMCFQLRLWAAYRFVACDAAPLLEVRQKIDQLFSEMNDLQEKWLSVEYAFRPAERPQEENGSE